MTPHFFYPLSFFRMQAHRFLIFSCPTSRALLYGITIVYGVWKYAYMPQVEHACAVPT